MAQCSSHALEACRTRGIAVEQWAGDAHGNVWRAVVPYRSRSTGARGVVHLVAASAEEAAVMALRYVGARGWQAPS